MQNGYLKFLGVTSILCLLLVFPGHSQSLQYHLTKADSLFQQKRYTQSLELYQSIFRQKQYTPAMLLKMAFMEEGLNHTARALYYLSLYYEITHDEQAFQKINELAERHNLQGYGLTDLELAFHTYQEVDLPITASLAAILIFLLALITYQRSKKSRPVALWIFFLLIAGLLAVHINWMPAYRTAIIARPNTYLMSGPSAGASVVRILNEGHRVRIYKKHDVWVQVKLNDTEVYIKETDLLPVSL